MVRRTLEEAPGDRFWVFVGLRLPLSLQREGRRALVSAASYTAGDEVRARRRAIIFIVKSAEPKRAFGKGAERWSLPTVDGSLARSLA